MMRRAGSAVVPRGSVGFRWGENGKWNLGEQESAGKDVKLRLSLDGASDEMAAIAFPYFGNIAHEHFAATTP